MFRVMSRIGVKWCTVYYDISWYSHQDTYRDTEKLNWWRYVWFCFICSISLWLLLENLNILKKSIYYMHHNIVLSWDLYRDMYRIMAILVLVMKQWYTLYAWVCSYVFLVKFCITLQWLNNYFCSYSFHNIIPLQVVTSFVPVKGSGSHKVHNGCLLGNLRKICIGIYVTK